MNRKPTEAEMTKGVVALVPFVSAWNLPLNPEDLHELAYAVLVHARGPELSGNDADMAIIEAAVREQIEEHRVQREEIERSYRES